jgi:hypothetical protein
VVVVLADFFRISSFANGREEWFGGQVLGRRWDDCATIDFLCGGDATPVVGNGRGGEIICGVVLDNEDGIWVTVVTVRVVFLLPDRVVAVVCWTLVFTSWSPCGSFWVFPRMRA